MDRITAEAGQRGKDVRSDCWVGIATKPSGGIQIDLKSKVEALYGESIRQLAVDTLTRLGVEHASVEIEDSGALPFVLMARLEAAVRRADDIGGRGSAAQALPERWSNAPKPTHRERFRRSRLYLPGNEPKFMLNAGLHQPDAIILDLEDSVAPSEKDAARILVRNALCAVDFRSAERMVRVNQGDLGLEDLDAVIPRNVHVVLIPKVEDPEQVRTVDQRIAEVAARAPARPSEVAAAPRGGRRAPANAAASEDGARSPVLLMPIIESALGAIRAYEIATASPNICALTMGLEDYTADLGTQRTDEGRESFWARCQVVNAARAAGVQAIDSVYSDIADMDALRASVLEAKGLGFEGKGCIHPRQIRVIHEAFAPTADELDKATRIVAAFEEAQAKGLAAVSLGTKMIDPPVVKRALRVVEMSRAMG
jgi:citrate lyase subunit beta/citryl-CoA lyase